MITAIQKIRAIIKHHGDAAPITKPSTFLWGLFSWLQSNKGWLWLDDHSDYWSIYLTSDKRYHVSFGPVYIVDIDKSTGLLKNDMGSTGAYKTAISVWPIRDPDEAHAIYLNILNKIDTVYDQLPVGAK